MYPGYKRHVVTKKWMMQNDKDGIRPKSIQVQLLSANGQKVGQEVELSAETSGPIPLQI